MSLKLLAAGLGKFNESLCKWARAGNPESEATGCGVRQVEATNHWLLGYASPSKRAILDLKTMLGEASLGNK